MAHNQFFIRTTFNIQTQQWLRIGTSQTEAPIAKIKADPVCIIDFRVARLEVFEHLSQGLIHIVYAIVNLATARNASIRFDTS